MALQFNQCREPAPQPAVDNVTKFIVIDGIKFQDHPSNRRVLALSIARALGRDQQTETSPQRNQDSHERDRRNTPLPLRNAEIQKTTKRKQRNKRDETLRDGTNKNSEVNLLLP